MSDIVAGKPVPYDIIGSATLWLSSGDHPAVSKHTGTGICPQCRQHMSQHGLVMAVDGETVVHPGSFVIINGAGKLHVERAGKFFKQQDEV